MESYTIISLVLIPIIFTIFYFVKFSTKSTLPKLPPGPKPWPIIGNLHQLGDRPHRSIAEFSNKYGPIMSLKLGSMTTIVISSPDVAKEMYLKHDLALSSRRFPDVSRGSDHYKTSMFWLPVGPKWRHLRKIEVVQLFSNQRLELSQGLRLRKVSELVDHVRDCCEKGRDVNIRKAGFTTTLNLLSNTFFSIDLGSHDSLDVQEIRDIISGMLDLVSKPNVSDFFPSVRHLDLQGALKQMKVYFDKMFGVLDRIIDDRLSDGIATKDDVLGTLLKLVKDDELSLVDVRHMLIDLFVAGTDSTSYILELAMIELLRNPEKMGKAQAEIDQVVSKNNSTTIQGSDISNLLYIQAVVKETLRLHPGSWVVIRACGRTLFHFHPKGFLGSEVDFKGRDFNFIPFGAGRRMCPGMPLADRMVHLMLANLLHSFNWKHACYLSPKDIDLEEKFVFTPRKLEPLLAIPLIR